jgi:hypothetical protein
MALENLSPRIVLCRQLPGLAQSPFMRRVGAQFPIQLEELARVGGFQHQGVPPWYGIILPGAAGTCHPAHGHGFQAHQAERFVLAVGEDRSTAV